VGRRVERTLQSGRTTALLARVRGALGFDAGNHRLFQARRTAKKQGRNVRSNRHLRTVSSARLSAHSRNAPSHAQNPLRARYQGAASIWPTEESERSSADGTSAAPCRRRCPTRLRFIFPMHLSKRKRAFHEPRSAAVPAASCGGVSPPARTPGEAPSELAGEDACICLAVAVVALRQPRRVQRRNASRGQTGLPKSLRRCTRRYSSQRDEFHNAKQIQRFRVGRA